MSKSEKFKLLEESIRNVPDFPKKGIQFKDITTALKVPAIFKFAVDHIHEYYKTKGITKVVSIESRGFIIGGALAAQLGPGSSLSGRKGNYRLRHIPGRMPLNMAKILLKFIKMPWKKMILSYYMTIYLPLAVLL